MFANRNFFGPMVSYLIIYLKNRKTQWNSREHKANSSRDVYWAKVTQQLMLSRRYSQLVANRCCRLACSLLKTPFVTQGIFLMKICSWTNLFVMRGVHELRFHCISFVVCVQRKSSTPTGRVFMKFNIRVFFFENLSREFRFHWNMT
jgi:hypothetical protein